MATGPVTEIVYIPLKPGTDLESGEGAAVLEDSLKVIEQIAGLQKLYYGRHLENPDVLQMVVVWTDISIHRDFENSPQYQPFLDRLNTITAENANPFHAKLPADTMPLDAPATECISAFFAPDADDAGYTNNNWLPFREAALKIPDTGAQGIVGGWVIERLPHEALGEGVEGKVFVAFIGWDSVQSHMTFRETEEFAKLRPLMMGSIKGVKMHHVKFTKRV